MQVLWKGWEKSQKTGFQSLLHFRLLGIGQVTEPFFVGFFINKMKTFSHKVFVKIKWESKYKTSSTELGM